MAKELTDRQLEILQFIQQFISETGYPPTLREIGKQFGMASTYGVQRHIEALEKKGYLTRDSNTSRGLNIKREGDTELSYIPGRNDGLNIAKIPVVGRVAAGMPITAIENQEGSLAIDMSFLKSNEDHFALKVKGDSMIDDGIHDGDFVIVAPTQEVSHDQIIVARMHDEVTVKRFHSKNGHVQLIPANAKYQPIEVKDLNEFSVVGKVVGVMRWIS
jgi:repressor LexA